MMSLSVPDSKVWPKKWEDNDKNARDNLDTFSTGMRIALLRTKTIRLRL
jgi:hypothetical protein